MELEILKTNASTITALLEEDGIMSVEELRHMANLKEIEVLSALDWLKDKERVELLSSGKIVSAMLIF
jgi:predicted transcriptional regulator